MRCASNLIATHRSSSRAVQRADTAASRGRPREQNAKPPQEPRSPIGPPKQARKPKEAKRKRLSQLNPKANLKKWAPRRQGNVGAESHQKPLPLSQSPNKAKGTQNTPKIWSFTTKGEGGFAAAIEENKENREERRGSRAKDPLQTDTHQKTPWLTPWGFKNGQKISRGQPG